MERHGIEWERLDTHYEHLSVLDYKKVQRTKEVGELEETLVEKQEEISCVQEKLEQVMAKVEKADDKLKVAKERVAFIAQNASHYDDDPKYQLSEPKPLMSAKSYHDKVAAPLVSRLKRVIRRILLQFFEKTRELRAALDRADANSEHLAKLVVKYESEVVPLRSIAKDYHRLRRGIGDNEADIIIEKVKAREQEQPEKKRKIKRSRDYAR